MKKICMIVPSFGAKGGIAAVVGGYVGSKLEKEYQIHYIETYCDGSKLKKLYKAIGAYYKFVRELIVFKPDLIHIHSSFGASFYRKMPFVYLAFFCRIPVVNHIHGSEIDRFYRNTSPIDKWIKRRTFCKCKRVVALTEKWREEFSVFVNKSKIEIINNYSVLKNLHKENQTGTKTVLFLGFLSELKGCFDIPEIAAMVRERLNDVRFVLAGSGSEEDVCKISRLSQEQNVDDIICFPGWVRNDEKDSLLQEASIYFLPSYTEGMPMSILEAMGCGLPIVSTTVGGIPQLVQNGYNGYLCEPGDVTGMADAILEILQNDEKRLEMGKASATIVSERYSLEQHIDQLVEIYESLL